MLFKYVSHVCMIHGKSLKKIVVADVKITVCSLEDV